MKELTDMKWNGVQFKCYKVDEIEEMDLCNIYYDPSEEIFYIGDKNHYYAFHPSDNDFNIFQAFLNNLALNIPNTPPIDETSGNETPNEPLSVNSILKVIAVLQKPELILNILGNNYIPKKNKTF
jgi:hypothetical protein